MLKTAFKGFVRVITFLNFFCSCVVMDMFIVRHIANELAKKARCEVKATCDHHPLRSDPHHVIAKDTLGQVVIANAYPLIGTNDLDNKGTKNVREMFELQVRWPDGTRAVYRRVFDEDKPAERRVYSLRSNRIEEPFVYVEDTYVIEEIALARIQRQLF